MPSSTAQARMIAVSTRALVQRINRQLASQDEMLKATRGDRWRDEVGDFYTLDLHTNRVVEVRVDPEALGRDLGVLKPHEHPRGAATDAAGAVMGR